MWRLKRDYVKAVKSSIMAILKKGSPGSATTSMTVVTSVLSAFFNRRPQSFGIFHPSALAPVSSGDLREIGIDEFCGERVCSAKIR